MEREGGVGALSEQSEPIAAELPAFHFNYKPY